MVHNMHTKALLTSIFLSISAPCINNNSTTSTRPFSAAVDNGVEPSCSKLMYTLCYSDYLNINIYTITEQVCRREPSYASIILSIIML